ncbi:MAG: hypothetical protein FWB97_02650 [Oscillospiraceae bacterium]|nr:hypothetical protein [Oscillospiraceae bacterium]
MKKSIYKKNALDVIRAVIVPILFTAAVMLMIAFGLHQTEQASRAEARRVLEDSIRCAVVVAYAIEGRYPESIQHIEKHYGIHIDWSRFVVHYRIFASNIFPDIAVLELNR